MEQDSSFTVFDGIIWGGAALSVVGLIGLVWCILKVWRARAAGLEDAEMRAVVARVLPLNLGALFVSVLGLMLVIVGIFLG
ncbi:hypothetical protein [Tateyamaria omphalii]|uniref:hypothetical protein n=1 Tax=Tateyamaria omphalii TaxID=299262 RepID=UPI0020C777BF|nr:hypothetical protein [Tateyamaria omphalii]